MSIFENHVGPGPARLTKALLNQVSTQTNQVSYPKTTQRVETVERGTSRILDQFYAGAGISFSNSRSKNFLLMFGLERGDQLLCLCAYECRSQNSPDASS